MYKIKHLLLTRFNIHIEAFDKNYTGGEWPGVGQTYLHQRIELFKKICIPSVVAQSTDFVWLVFFSNQTPRRFKEEIDRIAEQHSIFHPIYIDIPLH